MTALPSSDRTNEYGKAPGPPGRNRMNTEMQAAVDYLYDLPRFTKKNPLAHTRRLMDLLGDPCGGRKVIHVAGSNGKGSVCCFLYSMLLAGGADAAMFTSPHLTDIRERFQICGDIVSEEAFLDAYGRVTDAVRKLTAGGEEHPTFFEMVYAIGMVIFERAQAEYIVLETGLGGRLDATNCFRTPILSVITPISLEHTDILGDTVRQIAAEKAGILKPGVPVVYAADDPEAADVIAARAEELGCPAVVVSRLEGPGSSAAAVSGTEKPGSSAAAVLGTKKPGSSAAAVSKAFVHIDEIRRDCIEFSLADGNSGRFVWRVPGQALYQAENAALAIAAMHMLRNSPVAVGCGSGDPIPAAESCSGDPAFRLDDKTLQLGIDAAFWPGRMQEMLPGIFFDGAHNPAGIAAFAESAAVLAAEDPCPPMLLFAMAEDKDIGVSAGELTAGIAWDSVTVTTVPGTRGVPAEQAAALFDCPVEVIGGCREAFREMLKRKREGQKLFCTGSLYMIGALEEMLEESPGM